MADCDVYCNVVMNLDEVNIPNKMAIGNIIVLSRMN